MLVFSILRRSLFGVFRVQRVLTPRWEMGAPWLVFSVQRAHAPSNGPGVTSTIRYALSVQRAPLKTGLRQVALLRRVLPPGEKCGLIPGPIGAVIRIPEPNTGRDQNLADTSETTGDARMRPVGALHNLPHTGLCFSMVFETARKTAEVLGPPRKEAPQGGADVDIGAAHGVLLGHAPADSRARGHALDSGSHSRASATLRS